LVSITTLMRQQGLAAPAGLDRMPPDDGRALTPLIDAPMNPYGTFELAMQQRLHVEAA
jgi:phage baseplate assembly protein W